MCVCLDEDIEYHIFTCNADGTLAFGEACDSGCDECEVSAQDSPNGECFVNENSVHIVTCSEDLDATVLVYSNPNLDCNSDLSGEEAFVSHMHESGQCTVDDHVHSDDMDGTVCTYAYNDHVQSSK